ncbi:alpha/beta hydrolase [Pseudonocardiaceae bacterium YIM PH 21723]|nr:alpha/beta hydrolase [Pseudonocardiaceae bacterium YIM PH 21723]
MKRVLLASAISASLLLTTLPIAQAAASPWTPCGEDSKAECTTVTVPVDWARPDGPKIDLEVARQKATGTSHGVLFFGTGGPGGRSADFVKKPPYMADAGIFKNFDVVGVNARGLGKGYEIKCSVENTPLRDLPANPQEFAALKADNAAFSADCRKQTGPLYDHLDTASNARDLEAVRRFLAVDKVSYYGISYGTLLGQQYAQLFPHRVQHMVLDSTMDHSLPNAVEFNKTEAQGAEDNFDRFADWCDATASCALHGEDVQAVVHTLQQKADVGELKDSKGQPLTGLTLDSITFNAVFGKPGYPSLATELKKLADTGTSSEENTKVGAGSITHSILCQDWNFQLRDYADYQRMLHQVNQVAPMTRMSPYTKHSLACQGWSVPTVNPPKQAKPQPTPVLVINGRYDFATVYSWAENLSEQTGWTLLTYDGGLHGTYTRIPCATEYTDTYLLTGQRPQPGTHCAELPDGQRQQQPVPTGDLWG